MKQACTKLNVFLDFIRSRGSSVGIVTWSQKISFRDMRSFLFSKTSRPAVEFIRLAVYWALGLFPWMQAPFTTQVKDKWSYTSTVPHAFKKFIGKHYLQFCLNFIFICHCVRVRMSVNIGAAASKIL